MKTPLTKDLLVEKLKTKTPLDISKEYGYNVETVRRKIREFGIKRSRHAHLINHNFFKVWSHDMAYILGFLFADGSINTSLHHNQIAIQLNAKDIEIINFIKSKIQPTLKTLLYERVHKKTGKVYKVAHLTVSSKHIVQDLKHLGCVKNKTHENIRIPNVPTEFTPDFIRGVFDGDGSISLGKSNKPSCYICCSSISFLEDIQKILNFGNISVKDNPPRIYFYNKQDRKLFFNYMYNGQFRLNRKFEKFKKVVAKYEP